MTDRRRMSTELPEEAAQALRTVKANRDRLIAAREEVKHGKGSAQAVIQTNRQLRAAQSTLMHAMLKYYLLSEEDVTGKHACLLCDRLMNYAYDDGCCCECTLTD